MIVGHLSRPETYASLLAHRGWKIVFEWAKSAYTSQPADGTYPRDRCVRELIQTVQTKSRREGMFEAHRREIDVHVCLSGSELIEYAPVSTLRSRTEYNAEGDYTFYDPSDRTQSTSVELTPGAFAIFFPEDGHVPGLKLRHAQTRKVVFKVPYADVGEKS